MTSEATTATPLPKRSRSDSTEFSLSSIRDALVRQEETIIFAMIERGQFAQNNAVYLRGTESLGPKLESNPEHSDSFFEHFLFQTERLHSTLGRYRAGDLEHAFFWDRDLPEAHLPHTPVELWGRPLKPNMISVNNQILERYPREIASQLGLEGDDKHYGSTCVCDITLIQALSYRIHYGKLVAESKFRAKTSLFSELIRNQDGEGIMRELTDEKVEDMVVARVTRKAARYASEENELAFKVKPEVVGSIFRNFLIPLTKQVQVEYLLQRL